MHAACWVCLAMPKRERLTIEIKPIALHGCLCLIDDSQEERVDSQLYQLACVNLATNLLDSGWGKKEKGSMEARIPILSRSMSLRICMCPVEHIQEERANA